MQEGKNAKERWGEVLKSIRNRLTHYLARYKETETGPPLTEGRAVRKIVPAREETASAGESFAARLSRSLSGAEKEKLRLAVRGIGTGVLTFCLGRTLIPPGIRPLGIAMALASRESAPFAYIGLGISSLTLGHDALASLVGCFTSLTCRVLLWRYLTTNDHHPTLFAERLFFRVANAALSQGVTGLLSLLLGGFAAKAIGGVLLSLAVAPAAVWVYAGITEHERRFTLHHDAAVTALLVSLVAALRGITLAGFAPSTILAAMMTFWLARNGGALRGGVTGLLCGLAVSPLYAPGLALAGIGAGLLYPKSGIAAVTTGCGIGVLYGIGAGGIAALTSFSPDLIVASSLLLPLQQFGLLPSLPLYHTSETVPEETLSRRAVAEEKEKNGTARLEAMASSLQSLSEVFYSLSDRARKPGLYEVRRICEDVFRPVCDHCALNTACWDREYDASSDALNKLSEKLTTEGRVTPSDLPEPMKSRCPHALRLTEEVSRADALLLEEAVRRDKTEIFALDYEAMARLLGEAAKANDAEYETDPALTRRARIAARRCGLSARQIAVYGKRKICVVAGGMDLSRAQLSSDELRRAFGDACGIRLLPPRFDLDRDYVTMTLKRARRFGIECATGDRPKEGETQCGDSVATLENREDCFYGILSDGMGSGHDAAMTSRVTALFLEKMLESGNRKGTALEMLNHFIRSKNLECFATVDLLEVDLLTGSASFVKSGAAPSYILRDGKLFRISSSSLPVGITRLIHAEEIRFELKKDDVIVMVSDGVSRTLEDGLWLTELLTFGFDETPSLSDMAQRILSEAEKRSGRGDDRSVCLIRLREEAIPDAS